MTLLDCGPDGLRMQVTSAAWQPGHGWELTTETGRGQKRRGQHSSLILADQMNVRKGTLSLSVCDLLPRCLFWHWQVCLPTVIPR